MTNLIQFVNTWLNDWVGYVEETVFDVNMLSHRSEYTIICNNYNKRCFCIILKSTRSNLLFLISDTGTSGTAEYTA